MLPDCAPPPRSCARARPAIGGEGQALAGGGVREARAVERARARCCCRGGRVGTALATPTVLRLALALALALCLAVAVAVAGAAGALPGTLAWAACPGEQPYRQRQRPLIGSGCGRIRTDSAKASRPGRE